MKRPTKRWRVSYELWLNRWLPYVAYESTEDAAFSIAAHQAKYPGSYRAVRVEHWKNGAWTAADEHIAGTPNANDPAEAGSLRSEPDGPLISMLARPAPSERSITEAPEPNQKASPCPDATSSPQPEQSS